MQIDPRIEEPTREMLGHAIRGELPALEAQIDAVGDETYAASIALCMIAAGYIAVDVSAGWPTEADVREIARHTAATSRKYELREQDVYDYLSRGALGFQPIPEVFPDPEQDYTLPVLITAQMLVAFRLGDGHDFWGTSTPFGMQSKRQNSTDLSLLPALMLRSRQIMAAKTVTLPRSAGNIGRLSLRTRQQLRISPPHHVGKLAGRCLPHPDHRYFRTWRAGASDRTAVHSRPPAGTRSPTADAHAARWQPRPEHGHCRH